MFNKGQATSKRIASIFDNDGAILTAFKLLYSTPGAPIMYYGDEIGQKNLPVREGVTDTRKYVRGEFDWDEADRQLADPTSLLSRTIKIITNKRQ